MWRLLRQHSLSPVAFESGSSSARRSFFSRVPETVPGESLRKIDLRGAFICARHRLRISSIHPLISKWVTLHNSRHHPTDLPAPLDDIRGGRLRFWLF